MKIFILSTVALCISFYVKAQKKHVIIDSASYVVQMIDGQLTFDPGSIQLKVIRDENDSLNFYSSNFQYCFEIQNQTNETILCNRQLTCWNDSGLSNCSSLWGEPLTIKPNEKGTVTISAYMEMKRKSHTQRDFILITKDQNLLIPLDFDYTFKPKVED